MPRLLTKLNIISLSAYINCITNIGLKTNNPINNAIKIPNMKARIIS